MPTPNGTQFQVATDSGYTNKLVDYNGSYITQYTVASGVLTKGVSLYSRVRHSSVETGYKDWSTDKLFGITDSNRILYISNLVSATLITNIINMDTNILCVGSYYQTTTESCGIVIKMDLSGNIIYAKLLISQVSCSLFDAILDTSGGLLLLGLAVYPDPSLYINHPIICKLTNSNTLLWVKYIRIMGNTKIMDNHKFIKFITNNDKSKIYLVGRCYYDSNALCLGIIKLTYDLSTIDISWCTIISSTNPPPTIDGGEFLCGVLSSDETYLYVNGSVYNKANGIINVPVLCIINTETGVMINHLFTAGPTLYNNNAKYGFGNTCLHTDGYIYSCGCHQWSPYLVKYDTSGKKIWERYLSCDKNVTNQFTDIISNSDGYLYLVGTIVINSETCAYVCKIDSNANILWQKYITTAGFSGIFNNNYSLYAFGIFNYSVGMVGIDQTGDMNGTMLFNSDYSWNTAAYTLSAISVSVTNFDLVSINLDAYLVDITSKITMSDIDVTFNKYIY